MSLARLVRSGEAAYFEFEIEGQVQRRDAEMREVRYGFLESEGEHVLMAPQPVLKPGEVMRMDVAGRVHIFKGLSE